MKEIIKDIINDINMSTFIIGIIEVLIGAILIKTTIGISTMLLILGGVNIGKRTIWWKGALKVKENSIKNERSSIKEDIKDIEKYISFTSKRENFSHDTDWNWNKDLANKIEHILSDYKRVLKENELLRQQNISYKNNIHELKEVRNK